MRFTDVEKAVRILAPMLSESRRQRISSVVASRTSSVAVLLENAGDLGNRNAVMRSMDAFGVQTLHTLTHGQEKTSHRGGKGVSWMRTDAGARDWLVRREWSEVDACVRHLKTAGYSIASSTPDAEMKLEDIDFTQTKMVVAFGNEHNGLSTALLEASDLQFSIPMVGFVESLNLSVSVAVTLHQALSQRIAKLVRAILTYYITPQL